jgi:carbon starvation protein
MQLAWALIFYALAASALPIWLLLAPRDYLSTFMKLGTIFALACGIFLVLPQLKMPALSRFVDGSGPVVPGRVFPFCFITIACGAISGFHSLIASGTTPKILTRESYARPVGYGAMCLESLVAIMALIAACTLDPGVYLSMNMKGAPAATVEKAAAWGFPVTTAQMDALAIQSGEKTLFGRTGGAATLAVGMAQIFTRVVKGRGLDLWYHFAIMFEALFILTTLDAGTRVGRYLLQDILGNIWRPLADTRSVPANLVASGLMVCGWGCFLVQGVRDPLGGINSLWPLFGIANQLLAAIALCLALTVVLKMQLAPAAEHSKIQNEKFKKGGRPVFAVVLLVPLVWLLAVTMTAGAEKIFNEDPRIGFLAAAHGLDAKLPELRDAVAKATGLKNAAAVTAARQALANNRTLHFNHILDATVAAFFMGMVVLITVISAVEWRLLLMGRREATLHESEPVWLPDYAVVEAKSPSMGGAAALALALAHELSGETHLERARQRALDCTGAERKADLPDGTKIVSVKTPKQIYIEESERRFNGVKRCC